MTETVQRVDADHPPISTSNGWVRLERIAALAVTVWAIALQISAGAFIPPVAVYGLVFGGLAIFLRAERRKLGLVVAILATLALVGNLPGTIDELGHPESAPAFVLTLFVSLAAIVTALSGLAAFRGWSDDAVRATVISWTGLLTAGVIVALTSAAGVVSAEPAPGDVRVVAQGVAFDTARLVVDEGSTGFWVDNRDGIRHTFTIEEQGQQIDVPALSSQRADLDLAAGEYTVVCVVPGHENMRIDLTVGG